MQGHNQPIPVRMLSHRPSLCEIKWATNLLPDSEHIFSSKHTGFLMCFFTLLAGHWVALTLRFYEVIELHKQKKRKQLKNIHNFPFPVKIATW